MGGSTDIGLSYPNLERLLSFKTGSTLAIFKSPVEISFSNDKSNINFKVPCSLPKTFLTTLKLILQ